MFDPDSPGTQRKSYELKFKGAVDDLLDAVRAHRDQQHLVSNEGPLRHWETLLLIAVRDATAQYENREKVKSIIGKLERLRNDKSTVETFMFTPLDGPERVSDLYEPSKILSSVGIALHNHSLGHSERRISLRQARISDVMEHTRGFAQEGGYRFRL
ncbi:hypothetical protein JCM3766R1_006224 [Sporobolomyces carnicolor]